MKKTYWLLGFGCGIVLSGIIGAIMALGIQEYSEEAAPEVEREMIQSNENLDKGAINNETVDEYKTEKYEQDQTINEGVSTDIKVEEDIKVEAPETIEVYVPERMIASEIAMLLEEYGVIEDAITFVEFVREQKKTTKLQDGKLIFDKNGSYEEILEILVGK